MSSPDVIIGPGELHGKGVYAARDFRKGETVIRYALRKLSAAECDALPAEERDFIHSHRGELFLYGEPERYVNHAADPNTNPDDERRSDVAVRDIAAGEMITTDSALDDAA